MNVLFIDDDKNFKNPVIIGPDYFIYKYDNDTLIKLFRKNGQSSLEWNNLLTNKGQKISKMAEFDMPENYFKELVFKDGILVGYTMDNIFKQGYKKISQLDYKSRDKKIELLQLQKKRLLDLNKVGIIYGDIESTNIVYNPTNNRIIFLNIDNVRLKDKDFDSRNVYMSYYLKNNPEHPELLDHFVFNIHTISYLQNVFYPSVFQTLNEGKFYYELDTPANYKIANEMLHLNENYNGKLFIDNQKPFIKKRTR